MTNRRVVLPLLTIETCYVCQKTPQNAKLRLCSGCEDVAYCSKECQGKDWKKHKKICGKTDDIYLDIFYPFLACLASECRYLPVGGLHPALTRKVLNTPGPGGDPLFTFDGITTRVVLLGDETPLFPVASREWWPSEPSQGIRDGLFSRITNDGLHLPMLFSICLALVAEIYTTAAPCPHQVEGQDPRHQRGRFLFIMSPVVDFRIVRGSVPLLEKNRLAYYDLNDNVFSMGQDPDDQYRLYFKTFAGGEIFLDFGMLPFNVYSKVVDTEPYCKSGLTRGGPNPPVFVLGHMNRKSQVEKSLWKEEKRVSILRNPGVHDIIKSSNLSRRLNRDDDSAFTIHNITEEVAGRQCSERDKSVVLPLIPFTVSIIRSAMRTRDYVNFPFELPITFPIPEDNNPWINDDPQVGDFASYLNGWAQVMRNDKITPEKWETAFKAWKDSA